MWRRGTPARGEGATLTKAATKMKTAGQIREKHERGTVYKNKVAQEMHRDRFTLVWGELVAKKKSRKEEKKPGFITENEPPTAKGSRRNWKKTRKWASNGKQKGEKKKSCPKKKAAALKRRFGEAGGKCHTDCQKPLGVNSAVDILGGGGSPWRPQKNEGKKKKNPMDHRSIAYTSWASKGRGTGKKS